MLDREMIRTTVYSVMPSELIERIVLFGSMARGDYTADSDIDICIITNEQLAYDDAKFFRGKMSRIFAFQHHISTDIILKSTNELERYKNVVGAIENEIVRDGVSV
jgi:predicted nucleotidyltransferase